MKTKNNNLANFNVIGMSCSEQAFNAVNRVFNASKMSSLFADNDKFPPKSDYLKIGILLFGKMNKTNALKLLEIVQDDKKFIDALNKIREGEDIA